MINFSVMNFFVIIAMYNCISIVFADTVPRVRIRNGTLVGTVLQSRNGRDFYAFRGIRYARAPLGKLRFQAPAPPIAWHGVFNATADGSDCIQQKFSDLTRPIEGSEDCLYMNVYTPKSSNKGCKRYAVLVFFSGGAWIFGGGASTFFSPSYLMDHDIVLVNTNFRLGPLGFLSTSDDVIPGNQALKDHVQALRWVQENIEAFGGNPKKVTIMGESSGAASVNLLMLSPLARGLFQQAITESGSSIMPFTFNTPAMAWASAERLGRELNCSTRTSKALLKCLRTKDARDIATQPLNWTIIDGAQRNLFLLVVESNKPGAFLTEEPAVLVKTGGFADVPWLNGLNRNEGAFFTVAYYIQPNQTNLKNLDRNFLKVAPATLGYEVGCSNTSQDLISRQIRKHYFGNKVLDESTRMDLVNMFSDNTFKFSSVTTLKAYLRTKSSPIYFYEFTYRGRYSFTNLLGDPVRDYGVCHADELLYLFPVSELFGGNYQPSARDFQMVDIMTLLWTNFVITGKPVPRTTTMLPVVWPRVTTNALESFVIEGPGNFTITRNKYTEILDFWSQLPCRAGLDRSDSLEITCAITTATTAALTTPTIDKHSEVQRCQAFSQSVIGKENDSISVNKTETDAGNPFDNAFKMPTNYLPKKKRLKLESSGKPKLPSAGTSDQWMQYHSRKENDRKIKEEKLQRRKKLQEEKKLLAEERKKLQDKMKAIQQKIKEETK